MSEKTTPSQRITEVVTSWPGVESGMGRRGEFGFRVGRREIGHLHGDHAAHFSFPKDVWAELSEQGRIVEHPVFPGRVGRREIGHLHGDRAAHFGFPKAVWHDLHEQGRITYHPVFPGRPGFGARRIETEDDVRDVIALMRLNYDRIASARH